MYLDERSVQLLNELVRTPQVKSKELEGKFQLSRRQISYSFEKINQWLQSENLPVITKSRNGNFIIDKKILTLLSEGGSNVDSTNHYIPTEKERILLILLYILGKKEEISLFHITDLLEISRNTGISDLKEAADFIKSYNLSIVYSRTDGYDIEGEELQARRLLIEVVKSVLDFYNGHTYFEKILKLDISDMQKRISSIENTLNIHLTDESYETLPYIIEIIFTRIGQGKLLDSDFNINVNELADTEEYSASQMLIKENVELPKAERIWLTLQLLASHVRSADLLTDRRIKDLRTAIEKMIDDFERRSCTFMAGKEEIVEKLLLHMRPAYYRIKYHLTLKNQLSNQIIEEYSDLNGIVAASIKPLEDLIGEKFPPGEVVFITMFIAGQLMKQGQGLMKRKRALVVCTNGLTISKIMQQSLQEIFPEFYFAESLSLRQFLDYQLDYDIVFSTIPVQSNKPMYLINPLMNLGEKKALRRQVLNKVDRESYATININRLIETIKDNAIVTDEMALLTSLSKLFQEGQKREIKEEKQVHYGLKQFLPNNFIQIVDEVKTWQEAITLACAPLLERNIIKPSYVTTLIEANNHKQLYSFLGKSMAIPHAAPEAGVLADAFAMLILKKPVAFKNGHKVSIITPLAIFNQKRHLKALAELADIAESKDKIEKLINAEDVSDAWFIINGS
ncbi:hypothetical protein A8F94_08095 [Bacillus sp. FJAT-27225]|uniref:BglG family transcription antiterminator n=1 Tax=Bacillus sp. FJAT-27225 TaxID=1743144 RepID=UPI00080C22E3|nr:BglG family transcription antiterminator [Bacillus sp. FJAT-27225]OCA87794.1 hypothetical protein A8F94_08095 [Bacillus sp. FJAT-27225]